MKCTHAKRYLKHLACTAIVAATVQSQCFAQDDETAEESGTRRSNPSLFGKLFSGTSTTKPRTTPAPKLPRSTGNSSNGGIFVPLKSLSRAFQGNTPEIEEEADLDIPTPPQAVPTRQPREPFRNMVAPRIQERRDRAINDVHVEELDSPYPETAPSGKPSTQTSTPKPSATTATVKPKADTAPALKSFNATPKVEVADANTTTRRTATEGDKPSRSSTTINSTTSSNAPPTLIGVAASSKRTADETPSARASSPRTETSRQEATQRETTRKAVSPNTSVTSNSSGSSSSSNGSANSSTVLAGPKPSSQNSGIDSGNETLREMVIPRVKLLVNGPSSLLVDQNSGYEVVAKNESDELLNGLMVRVSVPPNVSVGDIASTDGLFQPDSDNEGNAVLWELEHLPPHTSKTLRLMLKASKPEHFALGVEWTVVPQTSEMQIRVQQPMLQLAIEGASEVDFGKPQMYRLRVRNPGNADAKGVVVSLAAEPYGSNQSQIGDVPAGSERVVEVELTFQQPGSLPILATATSIASKLEARSNIDVNVRQSELVATWYGPSEFYQGSIADYDLVITNTGIIPANGATCKVRIPAGADIVSIPPGAIRTGEFVRWDIKKIDPQEKVTFPFRLLLTKLGDNQLSLVTECITGAETKAEFVTSVDSIADLHLSVVDPPAPAPVGQPVVYEIVITNRGKKAATDVQVLAQFSEGIEPTRVEGQAGRIVPGQVLFSPIASIGANEKVTLKVVAEASKAGSHRFRAEVKCQGGEGDLIEEESTRYLATGVRGDRR